MSWGPGMPDLDRGVEDYQEFADASTPAEPATLAALLAAVTVHGCQNGGLPYGMDPFEAARRTLEAIEPGHSWILDPHPSRASHDPPPPRHDVVTAVDSLADATGRARRSRTRPYQGRTFTGSTGEESSSQRCKVSSV